MPALAGCFQLRPDLRDPDPVVKVPAVLATAEDGARDRDSRRHMATLRQLVDDLESEDYVIRAFAIHGLDKLTGQRLGYEPYGRESERDAAITRWRDFIKAMESPAAAAHLPADRCAGKAAR